MMKFKQQLMSSLLYLWNIQPVQANNFQEYYEEALLHNLQLQAQTQHLEALQFQKEQQGYLPEPTVAVGWFMEAIETKTGPQTGKISMQQSLPWFGTRAVQVEISQGNIDIQKQQLALLERQLRLDLHNLWSDLIIKTQQISILQEHFNILESHRIMQATHVQNGHRSTIDLFKIDIMQENIQADIEILQKEIESVQLQFNLLCNAVPNRILQIPSELHMNDAIHADRHPSIAKMDAHLEQLTHSAHGQQLQKYPKFTVGMDVIFIDTSTTDSQMMDASMNSGNALMPMFGIQVPIYQRKYAAGVQQIQAQIQSEQLQREALLQQFQQQRSSLEWHIHKEERTQQLIQSQIIKTQQSIDILLISFANSQNTMSDILQLQQDLLNEKIQYLHSQQRHYQAQAQLQFLEGGSHADAN